jgi:hypothetical protein
MMAEHTQWTPELEDALAARFPEECHRTKPKGGKDITFVTWTDYILRLNDLVGVGGWQLEVRQDEIGGRLVCTAKLEILGVRKSNVGDEEEEKTGYGTACTNAYSQAVRRACALFGLGMYLYYLDKGTPRREPAREPNAKPAERAYPLDGNYVIPKGTYEGKRIDDPDIPMSWLIPTSDKCKPKLRTVFETEIARRQKEAKAR